MRILACSLLLTAVAFADPRCRFAGSYSQSDLVQNTQVREEFLQKVIQQEAKFIKEIGYDQRTGLTLDGQQINSKTGMPIESPNRYTSASNEAIHIALLAKELNGESDTNMIYTKEEALEILRKKIQTFERFQIEYPQTPAFPSKIYNNAQTESLAVDIENEVSQQENAKLFWASYGLLEVLESQYFEEVDLISKLRYFKDSIIRHSVQNIQEDSQNNSKPSNLYESMMYLFADLSDSQMSIMKSKSIPNLDSQIFGDQHWDMIFLPYQDSREYVKIYKTNLIKWTHEMNQKELPGLVVYANQDMINPSLSTGLFLINKPVATAWYHSMLSGPAFQTQYGSVNAIHFTGSEDKFLLEQQSVLGMMGGLSNIVKQRMIKDQVYHKFIQLAENQSSQVLQPKDNENNEVTYALPQADFSNPREDFIS
eukprot:403359636